MIFHFSVLFICSESLKQIADHCSHNANLWINENGFLTGDMQMVLPSISNVQINPYTGYVKMTKCKAWIFGLAFN